MTKSMLFFIAVLIVALGARPVLAGEEREYVGETTVTTLPNVGIITMHNLCDADFPGARMCSSSDIIRNGGVGAALPAANAWLHPDLVTGDAGGFALDVSGTTATDAAFLSCLSWSFLSNAHTGLTLTSTGRIEIAPIISTLPIAGDGCDGSRPVACCAERGGKKEKN